MVVPCRTFTLSQIQDRPTSHYRQLVCEHCFSSNAKLTIPSSSSLNPSDVLRAFILDALPIEVHVQ